jgi:hypothetical protein
MVSESPRGDGFSVVLMSAPPRRNPRSSSPDWTSATGLSSCCRPSRTRPGRPA